MGNDEQAANFENYIKENINSFLDYLIKLYEFQEKIKVTYKIVERREESE